MTWQPAETSPADVLFFETFAPQAFPGFADRAFLSSRIMVDYSRAMVHVSDHHRISSGRTSRP
ncbi:hypothetical protein VDF37_20355 [Xanthomonas campestris pv. raphani]|uniref:hypothetical protein n=1 Tax=Xanthomonas campestris TaxID=339 RepID=UPI002B230677|nr:hypothetical protein [Xanthomonas campestris]MEA9676961.1 hypothetical protein [Xanthomonas campestris pv. raphani]